jgi:hypothetical protein
LRDYDGDKPTYVVVNSRITDTISDDDKVMWSGIESSTVVSGEIRPFEYSREDFYDQIMGGGAQIISICIFNGDEHQLVYDADGEGESAKMIQRNWRKSDLFKHAIERKYHPDTLFNQGYFESNSNFGKRKPINTQLKQILKDIKYLSEL